MAIKIKRVIDVSEVLGSDMYQGSKLTFSAVAINDYDKVIELQNSAKDENGEIDESKAYKAIVKFLQDHFVEGTIVENGQEQVVAKEDVGELPADSVVAIFNGLRGNLNEKKE